MNSTHNERRCFLAAGAAAAIALVVTTTTSRAEAKPTEGGAGSEKSSEPDPKSKLLWLDAQAGIENATLNTFSANFNNFAVGFIPRSGTGPAVDVGAGLRLVFVTLGVRGRFARFEDGAANRNVQDWSMSSLNGELGLRVPLGRLEPYATLGGGYTTFGGFSDAIRGVQSGFNVNGANARISLGVDYFVSRYISLGISGSGEVLALTRPGIPVREVAALPQSQTLDTAAVRFLEANGSTYGTAIAAFGGVKAHF